MLLTVKQRDIFSAYLVVFAIVIVYVKPQSNGYLLNYSTFSDIMARAKKAPPKKRERKSVSRFTYDETHLLYSKKTESCRNRKKWTEENQQKAKQKRAKQQKKKVGKNVSGAKLQGAKHAKKREQNKSNKKK